MGIGKAVGSPMKSLKKKISLLNAKLRVPYIKGSCPMVANIIILSQYFGSSFKTRGAPIIISLILKPI